MTIGGATRVACVIGDPVEHSRSPLMHNAAAEALGLDRVYVALRVAPADLHAALRGLAALGFDGANVTIPHKAAAAALCDELGNEAQDAGAVNTLTFSAGAGLRGDLTDGLGLVAALDQVPERAVLLGSGGSTRAAAAALLRAGTSRLTIVARRPEAAAELAVSLASLEPDAQVEAAVSVPGGRGGLLVNCTPVGGIADLKGLAAPADVIERMDTVADFAYRADGSPTPLAAAARAAGLPVVDGLELLVRQGALSFRRWTGIEPPLDVMRRAARGG
jgi:shikimate dehydrogenase